MSPIPIALILLIGGLSFWLTLHRSVGAAFAYVMMPVILLAYTVRPIEIQRLPDIDTVTAASYGALLAIMIRGWRPAFTLNAIDVMVIVMALWRVVASVATDVIYTGVSTLGSDTLSVLGPYFMARAAFVDPLWRRRSAKVLAGIAMALAFVTMIEFRLKPMFFAREIMKPLDLTSVDWVQVQSRFGFFRAQASFCHPIDLGNGAAIAGCMLLALALTSRQTLRTWWVAAGASACAGMVLMSMSFTSYVAVAAIGGLLLLLRSVRVGAVLLVPIGLVALIGYGMMTQHFATTEPEAPEWQHYEESDETSGSLYVRHLIVHSVWPTVSEAGVFGIGKNKYRPRDFGLESVDNSYALFILSFGWGYLALFLLTAFVIAAKATLVLLQIESGPSRLPMAAAVAGIIGTILGMYTVFFGFVYATLFWVLIGIVSSMIREVYERAGTAAPVQLESGRRAVAEAEGQGVGAFV